MPDQPLQRILDELLLLKKEFPVSEISGLSYTVHELKENLNGLKEDLLEIKEILSDPEEGLIVRINKNTEFRTKHEAGEKEHQSQMMELISLQRWRDGVTKALWILFTAVISIIITIVLKLS